MTPLKAGRTVDSMPHVIEWTEDGTVRQGQVWALAPVPMWDSSAYWVVPLHKNGSPDDLVRVTKEDGTFHRRELERSCQLS